MTKKAFNIINRNNHTVNAIFVFLIVTFVLIIPFYRGLFFRINYIPAICFVSIIFIAYMVYELRDKAYRPLNTYMDISVLLIAAAYLVSFFFAANAKDAFDILLLYSSYFMLYKLTSDLSVKNEKYKNIFINVIIASTFILSFTSMLHIAGIVDIKGAFIGKRLYGLYQYANTTASVLGVGIILSLNKLINEENTKTKAIYQMILTTLIAPFVFTLSRGGYLALAVVLLLNFILVKAKAKVKLLLGLFVSFLSSSILIYKFYILAEEVLSVIWVYYLISIITSALIIYVIYFIKNQIKPKFSDKAIKMVLITMAVIFVGAVVFVFTVKEPIEYRVEHLASEEKSRKYNGINLYELEPDSKYTVEFDVKASLESPYSYGIIIRSIDDTNEPTEIFRQFGPTGSEFAQKSFDFTTLEDTERVVIILYNYESGSYTIYKNVVVKDTKDIVVKRMEKLKYVPVVIANRLAGINLQTKNVSLRVYFAKDGLKIIKDYPIAGAGGGAWKNLYRQYQSIPYSTTEVHNFYVQYGTEVGIIGFAALIGLLSLLVISMIKSFRAGSPHLHVYLAAMLLLIHSNIDFNLSLAAVGYMLWMLIGIINSDKNTPLIVKFPPKIIGALALALSLVILLLSSSIYYGLNLGSQGAAIVKEKKETEKAIEYYEKASKFDRYNAAYRFDLAQIMNNQLRKTKDKKYYDEFMEEVSLIRKYEPYNHQYTPTICSMYLAIGKLEEASTLAEVKLQDEPLLEHSYMMKIDVNYQISNYYLQNKKVKEAIPFLERVIDAKDKLEEINTKLKEPLKLTGDYTKKLEAASRTLEMIKADMKQ